MFLLNLTPHPVAVLRDDPEGEIKGLTGVGPAATKGRFSLVAEIAPTGTVARAVQIEEAAGSIEVKGHTVPLVSTAYGEPTDLPGPQEGTMYIVSVLTAQAAKAVGRSTSDLLITSDPVRAADCRIIGCRKFAVI